MNWNIYEHEKMKEMKAKHPDWIWNRGDTHIILSVPGALEAYKTPVEPGNSFSPGPGTYGVSSWIYMNGRLYAPEEMNIADLKWKFEDGYLPLSSSHWNAGTIKVQSELFPTEKEKIYRDYYRIKVKNDGDHTEKFKFYLVIRSFGASGGPIRTLSGDSKRVWINGAPMILAEKSADDFGAVSYGKGGNDIGQYLKRGELPKVRSVEDDLTWASGAMEYQIVLDPGETKSFSFVFQLHQDHWLNGWMKDVEEPICFEKEKKTYLDFWRKSFSIGMDLPDKRFQDAFFCQLSHLYMFTVDNSIRITPISYPMWWLRDGSYVLNALNKGGFHDFAERALREIAHRDAFGGFGSEGDGSSDGIWILSEHYLLTRDRAFLEEMYPHIVRKAELIMKMRRTSVPLRKYTEFVIPKCMLDPNSDLMCLPAEDGLIRGRMDHGIRVIWINGFAYMAMKRVAFCARELGVDDATYQEEADEIKKNLLKITENEFGKDDRDINSAFWPTGWAERNEIMRAKFQQFWDNTRFPKGKHEPEKEWTYFEAGQAHNFMLLGEREKAWVSIEWFLDHHTAPGLYTYPEAIDGNTALLWPRTRGWDDTNFVTPHGWTAAEVFLLLRDCLIREEKDGIIIGSGIPESWAEKDFSVARIPTYFGKVDFRYDHCKKILFVITEEGRKVEVRHELPFKAELQVSYKGGTQ